MKVSKLFHWLYAFLMLLPILSIPVFMIYSHRHLVADNVPTLETTYKYQTNEVNTADDLVEGNLYHFSINNENLDNYLTLPSGNETLIFDFVNITDYDLSYYYDFSSLDDFIPVSNVVSNGRLSFVLYLFVDLSNSIEIYINRSAGNDYFCYFAGNYFMDSGSFSLEGDFIYSSLGNPIFKDISFISASTYNEIESANISYTDNVMNVFYNEYENALDTTLSITGNVGLSINNAYSYLVTNLFGISNSGLGLIIVKLLTYWTIVSIVYLIFDILMFLPLLAHKWIDKARME